MVPKDPLVTAIIRTYNRADIVGNAIDSVLNQTYKNFDLIILDDCSSDNTAEVCRRYQQQDHRVKYIRHDENYGTGKGFNTANSAANGKYVAYLDDDDTWRADKLEKQVKKFESCSSRTGMLTGSVQRWNSDTGERLGQFIPNKKGYVYWEALGVSSIIFGPPSVVMIKKCVLEDIGQFREDMPRGCCQQYFRRIAKKYELDFVEDVLLDYYFHKSAITAIISLKDIENSIIAYKIKIESIEKDLQKVPLIYAQELKKLGHFMCLSGRMKEGSDIFIKALKYNRYSLPLYILLLGSKTNRLMTYKLTKRISDMFVRAIRFIKRRSGV